MSRGFSCNSAPVHGSGQCRAAQTANFSVRERRPFPPQSSNAVLAMHGGGKVQFAADRLKSISK